MESGGPPETAMLRRPLSFLMTGRINQDPADNFFSQIRSKGGHRFNPSAKEFRCAYRNVSSTLIIAPIPSANCIYDSDVMLSTLARLSSNACCSAAHPDEPDSSDPVWNLHQWFCQPMILKRHRLSPMC